MNNTLMREGVWIVVFVLIAGIVFGATGFTSQQQIYYTGSSSSPSQYYQDALPASGNSDVGMEICGLGTIFGGGFYYINVDGTPQYALVTYQDADDALSFAGDVGSNASCFQTSGGGFITVSPSNLPDGGSGPDPEVYVAAFPAHLWIGTETVVDPSTLSNFIYANTNAKLRGNYTITRSYQQGTDTVDVSSVSASLQSSSTTFSKSLSDPTFGVSNERRIAFGLCEDSTGATCSDGGIYSSSAPFFGTIQFATDIGALNVNDQNTYGRYIVANGIGNSICIGANLQAQVTTITPDPVYYSQQLNFTVRIFNPRHGTTERNGGNVDVTTPFDVRVRIYNSTGTNFLDSTQTVATTISPNAQTLLNYNWDAFGRSGNYFIEVTADLNGDIAECVESDNQDTDSFELRPITLPIVYIDDTQTDTFAYPNVPYALDMILQNSDNDTLANATVNITEINGLSLFSPTQIYNRSTGPNGSVQDGVKSTSTMTVTADADGYVNVTIFPTYNQLLLGAYNYTDIGSYISNHTLYFTGQQADLEDFIFVRSGSLTSNYEFTIANTSYSGSYPDKGITNERLVTRVMDLIYHAFTNFIETVVR